MVITQLKSQHGCIRWAWALREHITSSCHDFACGGMRNDIICYCCIKNSIYSKDKKLILVYNLSTRNYFWNSKPLLEFVFNKKAILAPRNYFLQQENNFCTKKKFSHQDITSFNKKAIFVTRNKCLHQEIDSSSKILIFAPRNKFLQQEMYSCNGKLSFFIGNTEFIFINSCETVMFLSFATKRLNFSKDFVEDLKTSRDYKEVK